MKYTFPDEKIPKDSAFRTTCPECQETLIIWPGTEEEEIPLSSEEIVDLESEDPSSDQVVLLGGATEPSREETPAESPDRAEPLPEPSGKSFEIPPKEAAATPPPLGGLSAPALGKPLETPPKEPAAKPPTFGGPPAPAPARTIAFSRVEVAPKAPTYDASTAEYFEEGTKTALLCVSTGKEAETLTQSLEEMDYIVIRPKSHGEALHRLKFNKYDLIIVEEEFAGATSERNAILSYLQHLSMSVRRYHFLILLSKKLKTFDNMTAFSKSVNLALNEGDIPNFKNILKRALGEHETFYKVFLETLKDLGKR